MINHIVSFGETLSDIAVKYDMSINEILKINPQLKNPDALHSGQDINVHPKEYEAPIDMGLYCLSCNPDVHWLELRFKSENNEGIAGLNVTIMDANNISTTQPTDSTGMVRFDKVALGAVSVWVEQKHLLSTVEQYASRDKTELPDSAIKAEAEANQHRYRYASVADLWDTPPDDAFLIKHHPQQFKSRGQKGYGMQVPVNQTIVFEIKALRSLVPYLLDTDDYNLVTAYNTVLLSYLSYADYVKGYYPDDSDDFEEFILSSNQSHGYVNDVLASWRAGQPHSMLHVTDYAHHNSFILKEVPYSLHLKGRAFVANKEKESTEAFVLYNQESVVVVMRGTEDPREDPQDAINDLTTTTTNIRLDGEPIPYPDNLVKSEYYAHTGFYRYTALIKDQLNQFMEKSIFIDEIPRNLFVVGHSLGGAAALLYSVFISENLSLIPFINKLRLFTYGEPRSVNEGIVLQKSDLLHYRHVNFADFVPRLPPNFLGFYHHGRLIQLFDYSEHDQVMVFPEQSGIDTLGSEKKQEVENDTYRNGMGLSASDHSSKVYAYHLLTHLCYYAQTDHNQQQRYHESIERLESNNRALIESPVWQNSRAHYATNKGEKSLTQPQRELAYHYDTNIAAIEWLKHTNASALSAKAIIFGHLDDTELEEAVLKQVTPLFK